MVTVDQGGLWSDRQNWTRIAEGIAARRRHNREEGHAGVCVLNDPRTENPTEMLACTRALPACDTILGRRMRSEIDDLVEDNRGNPLARRALILEGEATYGKTTATMLEVLRRSRAAITELGATTDGIHVRIPWAYVEVGANYGYRDIAEAIQKHLNLPYAIRDTAQARIAHLRVMLPKLGTEGVVIDDAHNLRGNPDSRVIDGLKNLLTGLPVSFVFIGLSPMSKSALLTGALKGLGSSVHQIARRSSVIPADLGLPEDVRRSDWDRLMTTLVGQFHLPNQDALEALTDSSLKDDLYVVSKGLFGGAYTLLRRAAVTTIRDGKCSFADAIRAVLGTRSTGTGRLAAP